MTAQNKGLTKPGVVVIQTFLIAVFTVGEIHWREGVGVVSGLSICIATFLTIRFARSGTAYVAAATAPLAFAVICIASLIAQDGIHPSRLGVDIVSSFASAAPYLILSAIYGWFNYFRNRKEVLKK